MHDSAKRKHGRKHGVSPKSIPRPNGQPVASVVVCIFLVAIVFVVFGQTVGHDFINYDDPQYVYENSTITGGPTIDGIRWAFTNVHAGNWHPLTTISHMLDCQLYGTRPSGHHFTNVLLHALTAVFLFLGLRALTGVLWSSAVVAVIFAIHPLRVESVAWISERKDVLSGVFFALTLWAYAYYARNNRFSPGRYAMVIVLFALGLLCKPTLVTLPFLLLLLDYWPLRRVVMPGAASRAHHLGPDNRGTRFQRPFSSAKSIGFLLTEKLPLFILSMLSCAVTLIVQKHSVALVTQLSFGARLGNAILSYAAYVGQMIWPMNLAVVYPYSANDFHTAAVVAALLFLVVISVVFFLCRRRFPYLIVGWLWFLGVLVPMIGLVQVGVQIRADRYTYLAQIGLYILVTWGATHLIQKWRSSRGIFICVAVLVIAALATGSYVQASYWQNSETLWHRVLANLPNNSIAENNLGLALKEKGKPDDAIVHFQKAVENCTNCSDVYNNLGNTFAEKNEWTEAEKWFRATIQSAPEPDARNYNSLGICLAKLNKGDEAVSQFREAVRLNPDLGDAHYNLAMLLVALDQPGEAVIHFKEVLRLKPDDQTVKDQLRHLGVNR